MEKQEFLMKLHNIFTELSHNPNSDVYRIVSKEFGYLDLPKKRSLSDLSDFEVLYRGFREYTHIEEFLTNDENDFYIGEGNNFGKGIYISKDEIVALNYTYTRSFTTNKDRVLNIYIKDCKMIEYLQLIDDIQNIFNIIKHKEISKIESFGDSLIDKRTKAFIEFAFALNDKELEIVFYLMGNEISAMGVILGYDIIDLRGQTSESNFLILNRSKIHVLDSDYDRILGQSKRFKKVDPSKLEVSIQKGE